VDDHLTGHYFLFTYKLPPKGNCGSFVVRRGGLLWMTSVIVSIARIAGCPFRTACRGCGAEERRPGVERAQREWAPESGIFDKDSRGKILS
jgi:hypothetical protein